VLETADHHGAGIWEMGMNHPGEIAPLCQIAQPKIGIITNIGTAHIEYMKTQDAIAEEKGALARALPSDGHLVIPVSCKYYDYLKSKTRAKVIGVGNGRGVVRAENIQMTAIGSEFDLIIEGDSVAHVSLPVVGRHMVSNAMLAAGVGHILGMGAEEIAGALTDAEISGGRLRSFISGGVRVIDDTYNANPESVRAAIDTLSDLKMQRVGKRVVVLGKMAELGEHAEKAYLDLGKHAANLGIQVVSVGDEAQGIAEGAQNNGGVNCHFSDIDSAADYIQKELKQGDAVLFKGSRAAAMEKVLERAFN